MFVAGNMGNGVMLRDGWAQHLQCFVLRGFKQFALQALQLDTYRVVVAVVAPTVTRSAGVPGSCIATDKLPDFTPPLDIKMGRYLQTFNRFEVRMGIPVQCVGKQLLNLGTTINAWWQADRMQDDQIDQEFEGLMRKLITFMMEDPRTISSSIDLVFVAKTIERVGDHAKNLAEQIIYIVKGTDVRHNTVEEVETMVR